jgi:hypothetical protein
MDEKVTIADVASEGGKARAESLTQGERTAIAKKAAEARWNKTVPKATHSGELHINGVAIPCAVLHDETRVLTQRGFSVALGRYKNPNKKGAIVDLPVFLSASNLNPFVDEDLARSATPIKFRMAEGSGGFAGNVAFGYRAELLPQVCNVYLRAKHEGKLLKSQEHIADQCLILLNGLATVGVIALVDEATGYQYDRLRDDLQRILEKYVSKELARYSRVFEPDFYKHIHRLKGWKYDAESTKRTHALARVTVDLTYDRIHPDLLKELKQTRLAKGKNSQQLHRWLTTDPAGGHPRLKQHAEGVTALLSVAGSWLQLEEWLNMRYPKMNETMKLLFKEDDVISSISSAPPPPS